MGSGQKLTYDDVKDCIVSICNENLSKEKMLIQIADIQSTLKIEKDIEVTSKTIREYGIRQRGYFEKAYSDSVTYNNDSDNKKRGLVVAPDKFIEEVNN